MRAEVTARVEGGEPARRSDAVHDAAGERGRCCWGGTAGRGYCGGTPIANRNAVETEGLIGFFVNTLVLRSEVKRE